MRHFFIEHPGDAGSTSLITDEDARHIRTVLRLKPGDAIGLFDGKGFEYEAQILSVTSSGVEVEILRRFPATCESPVYIAVAQGFLKENKMDELIRQLSEIGINRWTPFFAERSVAKPDPGKLAVRRQRWQKIAKAALKQCKRGRLMEIGEASSFEAALEQARGYDLKVIFWEDEPKPALETLPGAGGRTGKIFAMLGPEGGLTAREVQRAGEHGFVSAALGPRIMRAETATVAACVLLQFIYGDMGKNGRKIS